MPQQKCFGLPCIEVKEGCFPVWLGFLLALKWRSWQKKKKNQVHLLRISPEFMQCTVWQFTQCTVMLQRGMEVVSEL